MLESSVKLIIILLMLASLQGCNRLVSHPRTDIKSFDMDRDISIRFPEVNQPVKAVALIIHGLNFLPNKMDDWALLLAERGAISVRLSLYGHTGDLALMQGVNQDIWRTQVDMGFRRARDLAEEHGVSLVFLGYSLGGLLGVDWVSRQEPHNRLFDKMLLLAPAIATPWYSEMARLVLSELDPELIVFTPSPKEVRANHGSSVNAYRALFNLKSSLEATHFKNANIDTLVMVDRFDELTPFDDIKDIIKKFRLGRWKLETVDNTFAKKNFGFRHLIADRQSVGPLGWSKISERALNHFGL